MDQDKPSSSSQNSAPSDRFVRIEFPRDTTPEEMAAIIQQTAEAHHVPLSKTVSGVSAPTANPTGPTTLVGIAPKLTLEQQQWLATLSNEERTTLESYASQYNETEFLTILPYLQQELTYIRHF